MELNLCDKNVFITASSDGIGKASADAFLKEGATVIINGRNEKKLAHVLAAFRKKYGEKKVYAICGDMSNQMSIKQAAEEIRDYVTYVNIVVGNLGTGRPISDDKWDIKEWRYMLNINLLSAVGLIKNTWNLFPKTGGSIAIIASLAAHDRISAPPAYAASKAGIISLVKYAAPVLAEHNIRINAVSPGNIFEEGGRWEELLEQDPEGIKTYIGKEVPLKRFGKTEEIAETLIFLCSEKSNFTTGAVVQVDGGQGRGY